SLFCVKKSNNPNAKTLMIATSLDELGLMVSDYESDGTLKFVALEGMSPASLLHQKVVVYTRDHTAYSGVVACNKVRFMEDPSASIKMDMLVLDMGMTLEEAKDVFTIGDLVSLGGQCEKVGTNCVMGKQLNTRMMLEAIIEISERLKGHDLDFNVAMGGIAQSVVGWRGTKT
ncbi:Peptidase M42, partial [gut metagenome]